MRAPRRELADRGQVSNHKGLHNIMPRIKTTRTVTIALVVLRLYLVVMLGLILFKFLHIFG